jgi:hypothetical protein
VVPVSFTANGLFLVIDIYDGDLLQDWILLKFLLNKSFQLEGRRLQQSQRLLELRREHLRECHLLRKLQTLSHDFGKV